MAIFYYLLVAIGSSTVLLFSSVRIFVSCKARFFNRVEEVLLLLRAELLLSLPLLIGI